MRIIIPPYVKPFLWSYDTDRLDDERDKKRIVTNVLNLGTKKATDWLFSVFKKEDIRNALMEPLRGEWNKKSLNLWSLIFNVHQK
ncbi:MAG: hypothetical protein WCX27_01375 [Candidatus Paceibacterota bacterium]|jgi:hypothetical protein